MIIFLAKYKTITTPYMQSRIESEWLYRLVQAKDEEQAEEKLRAAVTIQSAGEPVSLWAVEFSRMIT